MHNGKKFLMRIFFACTYKTDIQATAGTIFHIADSGASKCLHLFELLLCTFKTIQFKGNYILAFHILQGSCMRQEG